MNAPRAIQTFKFMVFCRIIFPLKVLPISMYTQCILLLPPLFDPNLGCLCIPPTGQSNAKQTLELQPKCMPPGGLEYRYTMKLSIRKLSQNFSDNSPIRSTHHVRMEVS